MPLKTPDAPKHQLADEAGIPRGAVLHTTWGVEARHVTADPKVGSVEMLLKSSFQFESGRAHEGRTLEASCLRSSQASCPVGLASRNGGGWSTDER